MHRAKKTPYSTQLQSEVKKMTSPVQTWPKANQVVTPVKSIILRVNSVILEFSSTESFVLQICLARSFTQQVYSALNTVLHRLKRCPDPVFLL